MAAMLNLRDIFELVVDGFNERALAQQELIELPSLEYFKPSSNILIPELCGRTSSVDAMQLNYYENQQLGIPTVSLY